MKKFLRNLWKKVKGWKSIICLLIVSLASQSFAVKWFGQDACLVLTWIFGTGGALSIIAHTKKNEK
jgi:hypothetical protein